MLCSLSNDIHFLCHPAYLLLLCCFILAFCFGSCGILFPFLPACSLYLNHSSLSGRLFGSFELFIYALSLLPHAMVGPLFVDVGKSCIWYILIIAKSLAGPKMPGPEDT